MTTAPIAASTGLREIFPHVRADLISKFVEFDAAISPMLAPDPQAPLFFLEVVACTPDTREHEALVVVKAKPSHIHAAMLLLGLTPGEPGKWKLVNNRLVAIDPKGPRVHVEFEWPDAAAPGGRRSIDPTAWIINVRDKARLGAAGGAGGAGGTGESTKAVAAPGWVFAGSRLASVKFAPDGTPLPQGSPPREVYTADEAGAVIGLATFGGEMIAWSRTFSPDANVNEPEWIADFAPATPIPTPPPPGTAVVVRIRPE